MCQGWLRELLASHQGSSTSRSDNSTSPHSPDLLLHFGGQTLPCSVQQHILQLDPWLLPAHLCPCHHLPMQPSNSSTAAAAHAAASATSSDAGSMAALLMLPEVTPWSCSVTGQAVGAPLSSCTVDARILQLGRHTQLTMPTAAPAAAGAATDVQGGGMVQRRLGMLQALAMPPTQPCELTVQHKLAPSAIDSMLLYGMPMLLCPATGSSSSSSSRPSAPTAAAPSLQDAAGPLGLGTRDQGMYQQDTSQQQQGQGPSAAEVAMLMRALCQLLLEEQQVLVAHSNHDLLRRIHMPLQQWYMLQPAADGSSLLLRWIASREQLLPPLARDSNGLGSCIGGAAAAAALQEPLADQVVLLDAEQLESVRASLARLDGLNPGGSGSARQAVGAVSTAAEGQVAAACLDSEASPPSTNDLEGLGSGQPLLLSCGLDAWVSAVLESSTATYTPQAAGPPAAAPGRAPVGAAGHSASAGQVMQDMRHPQAPTTAQTAGHGCTPQPPAHTMPPVMQPPVEQGSKQCGMDASSAGHGRAGGQGCAGSSVMPPIAPAGQSSYQQCQLHSAQQQQQQRVVPEAGMVSGGVSAGDAAPAAPAGRAAAGRGGRGRRNSSSGTAAGRKLKLSKV